MTTDDKVKDEIMQYDIKREAEKYQLYRQVKLINMSIVQVKKYYHLIKLE